MQDLFHFLPNPNPTQQQIDQAKEYLRSGMLISGMGSYKKTLSWKKQTAHRSVIPTYVIVDADGLVRHRVTGGDFDLRSQVRPVVEKRKAKQGHENIASTH